MSTENQNAVNAGLLFIRDAKERECKAYTLTQVVSTCEASFSDTLQTSEQKKVKLQKELKRAQSDLDDVVSRGPKETEKIHYSMFEAAIGFNVFDFYSKGIFGIFIGFIMTVYGIVFYPLYFLLVKPFLVLHLNKAEKSKYESRLQQNQQAYDEEVKKKQSYVDQYKADLKKLENQNGTTEKRKAVFETYASELISRAERIKADLQGSYDANRIPGDYRNLICMSIMEDALTNFKADTIKEALVVCDGEISRVGLHDCDSHMDIAMKKATQSVRCISRLSESIDKEVSAMSGEIMALVNDKSVSDEDLSVRLADRLN